MPASGETAIAVFFYGLFMDQGLLGERGITAASAVQARLDGYRLLLGARATLVPETGSTVYGLVMQIGASDLARLYAAPGLEQYRPTQVRVVTGEGTAREAACYLLPQPLPATEPDRAYATRLHALGVRLGLPAPYLASIATAGGITPSTGLR